jgi:predicted GIY-YIG superfamily endonuclease
LVLPGTGISDKMSRRNAKHSCGKAKASFRRSRRIKIAGRFYLESE